MTNYIVSGLERSGTSLVMQILEAGGFPIYFNNERAPDSDNPKGYYELEGGKILSSLLDKKFDFKPYDNSAIKITAYGLFLLPGGDYKIIFIERDIEEVYKSQQIKIGKDEKPEMKCHIIETLSRLNDTSKDILKKREDINYIIIKHRNLFTQPKDEIQKISDFVGGIDIDKAMLVIDQKLYRNRNG